MFKIQHSNFPTTASKGVVVYRELAVTRKWYAFTHPWIKADCVVVPPGKAIATHNSYNAAACLHSYHAVLSGSAAHKSGSKPRARLQPQVVLALDGAV